MTPQNTMTFSSVGDFMRTQLKTVDEVCPIHGTHLVTAFGRKPICLKCVKAQKQVEDQKFVDQAMANINQRKTQSWLTGRSIFLDETLAKATFENYRTDDSETAKNKDAALKIAREYFKGAKYNTILTGKPGVGKSHLAMSMLKVVNEYSEPYRRCLFVSLDEVMRRIKDSFGHTDSLFTENKMIDLLISADLLVLDDLGAETGTIGSNKGATDFTTRTLYAVINGRMTKPTIITTNLSSKEMAKMYDSKLVSRMFRGADGHVIMFKETSDKRRTIQF